MVPHKGIAPVGVFAVQVLQAIGKKTATLCQRLVMALPYSREKASRARLMLPLFLHKRHNRVQRALLFITTHGPPVHDLIMRGEDRRTWRHVLGADAKVPIPPKYQALNGHAPRLTTAKAFGTTKWWYQRKAVADGVGIRGVARRRGRALSTCSSGHRAKHEDLHKGKTHTHTPKTRLAERAARATQGRQLARRRSRLAPTVSEIMLRASPVPSSRHADLHRLWRPSLSSGRGVGGRKRLTSNGSVTSLSR